MCVYSIIVFFYPEIFVLTYPFSIFLFIFLPVPFLLTAQDPDYLDCLYVHVQGLEKH
jgi:hypothetical protein